MAWEAQGWLLERPKVRAKSMQKLLGHNAALRGRSLQLGLRKIRWNGAKPLRAKSVALRFQIRPKRRKIKFMLSKRTFHVEVQVRSMAKFLGVKLKLHFVWKFFRPFRTFEPFIAWPE